MPDLLDAYLDAAARRRAEGPGGRRAAGGTASGASSRSTPMVERRARATVGRFRPIAVKIMQDGVAENFTAAMTRALPRRLRLHDGEQRAVVRRPRGPARLRHATGRRGLPGALPRARGPGRARGPRRGRGGPRRPTARRRPAPPRAPAGRPPRRRAAASRRSAPSANIQPLWACHEPQMDELTIPFLGDRRAPPGSTRSATSRGPVRASSPAATGRSAAPNPLEGIHVAVNRRAPGERRPRLLPRARADPSRR